MTQVNCSAVGTVMKVSDVQPKTGKAFTQVDIELAPETRTGNSYKQRVSIRVAGETPSCCVKGEIVSISGPGSMTCFEYNGKWYARLTIWGRPESVCPAPFAKSDDDEPPAPPPASPIARGTKGQPALPLAPASPPITDEIDDVPFRVMLTRIARFLSVRPLVRRVITAVGFTHFRLSSRSEPQGAGS